MTIYEVPGFPMLLVFRMLSWTLRWWWGDVPIGNISMCTFLLLYKWFSRPSSNFDPNFILARVALEPERELRFVSVRGSRSQKLSNVLQK